MNHLRFSHGAHDEVTCQTCHAAASTSQDVGDDLTPGMQVCASCHAENGAERSEPVEPRLADCNGCHVGYGVSVDEPITEPKDWKEVRPAPMVPPKEQAHLHFDHATHVELLLEGENAPRAQREVCQTCHGSTSDDETNPQMPTMGLCRDCHADVDTTKPLDACQTCHPTTSTGQLMTDLSSSPTDEAETLKPTDHTADWIARHGSVARSRPDDCASCHTEQDCSSCHDEQAARPFSVHPPNFDTLHAVDARANTGECTDCHNNQTFCTSCHTRAKVAPGGSNRPSPRFEFHPPGWLRSTAPNNHGVMARRNINDCASCHSENDCVQCHSGINPHPPEFRLECRQWLDANPRPCTKCHTDLRRLRRMCL